MTATCLVSCGGATSPRGSAVVSAPKAVDGGAALVSNGGPAAVPFQEKVFAPSDAGFQLSFGRFGYPCDLEFDTMTRVVMLSCDSVDAPDKAGITVNFYLPGIWSAEPFTAESVAVSIGDNNSPNTRVLSAFGAPDRATGKLAFFLTTSALYPEENQGQAFIMKVAPLEDAVYSLLYTTMFSGSPDGMATKIREWLASHNTDYLPEISGLTPNRSWVPYLRSKLRDLQSQ